MPVHTSTSRIRNLNKRLANYIQVFKMLQQQLKDSLGRVNLLESENEGFKQQIAFLLKDMNKGEAYYCQEIFKKDRELRSKDEQIDRIDNELTGLKTLLARRESSTGGRGIKRKKVTGDLFDVLYHFQQTGNDVFSIEPFDDYMEKRIMFTNKYSQKVDISNWALSNISELDGFQIGFKFPVGTSMAPKESCYVWSSDSQQVCRSHLNK